MNKMSSELSNIFEKYTKDLYDRYLQEVSLQESENQNKRDIKELIRRGNIDPLT